MVAKDKVAIVRFVPRQTSAVRFCALVPQQEAFDEDNFQTPPGFNLIFLPFADDIRKPDSIKPVKKADVSRENVVNAKVLIKSLALDFDSRNFTNPNIQNFFNNLQAIALNEEEPEEVEDLLEPDEEGFEKYQPIIESFKTSIWGDRYSAPTQTTVSRGKRKTDDGDNGGKRAKKEKVDVLTDADDYKPAARGRGGAKKGARGAGVDMEEEGNDEYDYNDDFLVDDRPKNKTSTTKRRGAATEAAGDDDTSADVENKLSNGDVTPSHLEIPCLILTR